MSIKCVVQTDNVLGEGPLWDAERAVLYWVDIANCKIHWLDHRNGNTGSWRLSARASALALRKDGSLLVATDQGFGVFDTVSGTLSVRLNPEPERMGNRSNDGHADALGRFWVGTMDNSEQIRSGAVYRLDPDWTCTRMLDGLGIPNGVICTPDCTTLFVAESKDCEIYSVSLDHSDRLSGVRLFAHTHDAGCTPDGAALDEEGFLWNAQWGGSRIVRYAPTGAVDRIVTLPVEQPTSCAFGGPDLSTLFVTSARQGLSPEELARQPLAGSLLSFRPGVRGIQTYRFGG